jgi:hypothetical protein
VKTESDEQVTDLSLEIADFWAEMLVIRPEKSKRTFVVIAEKLGADKSILPEIIGALTARVRRLRRQVEGSTNYQITPRLRADVLEKLKLLELLLSPLEIWQPWESLKQKLSKSDLQVVSSVSGVIQLTHPLKKLSEKERQGLLESIETATSDLLADDQMPEWAKAALIEGLSQLRLLLKYLPAFGHEAVVERLVFMNRQTAYVTSTVTRPDGKRPNSLRSVTTALLAVVGAFSLPHETYQASTAYVEAANVIYALVSEINNDLQNHEDNDQGQQPVMLPPPPRVDEKEQS